MIMLSEDRSDEIRLEKCRERHAEFGPGGCLVDEPDKVTCFHCKNARVYGGSAGSYYVQPDPPEVDCQIGDRDSTFQDDIVKVTGLECVPENAARFCPHFMTVCGRCEEVILNVDEVHGIGGTYYGEYSACSMICLEYINRSRRRYFNGFLWVYD